MSYEFNAFTVRDGKITLYKRNLKNSAVWQCRFMAQGKCIRRSTKESSVSAATAAAEDLYDETRYKIKNNIPIGLATFEAVWKKWIIIKQGTEKTWSVGGHRLRYANITANAHFLPYFGKKPITAVTTANVTAYWPWRIANARAGKVSAGTLKMEAQLLTQFLKWALDSSHIAAIPKVKSPLKKDPKETRRQAFTDSEYSLLKGYIMGWVNHPKPDISHRRRMFRNFVMVMFASGMRQNEARQLKWQNVDIKEHAVLSVDGKTGPRGIVAQPEAKAYLDDQRKASAFTKPDDFVFANPSGKATANFDHTFRTLLTGADMLLCADGSKKVIYSMRHSYCTWRLLDGDVEMDKLARNMGTSKEMIEQHYGHVTNVNFADALTKTNKKPSLKLNYTVIDDNNQT